jgi:hypothetical protein
MKKRYQCQWLMPIILATQEAEIRRITVRSQPWGKEFARPFTKKWGGRVTQGEGPEFKPQYCKKKEIPKMLMVNQRSPSGEVREAS